MAATVWSSGAELREIRATGPEVRLGMSPYRVGTSVIVTSAFACSSRFGSWPPSASRRWAVVCRPSVSVGTCGTIRTGYSINGLWASFDGGYHRRCRFPEVFAGVLLYWFASGHHPVVRLPVKSGFTLLAPAHSTGLIRSVEAAGGSAGFRRLRGRLDGSAVLLQPLPRSRLAFPTPAEVVLPATGLNKDLPVRHQ